MGIKISMSNVPDSTDFSLLPFGKYPVRMKIDAYQHDQQGNFALDNDGQKVYWLTAAGDPKWNMELEILEGPHAGRRILDNLNFSNGGLKRVKVLYVRGGFGDATDEVELEPEDFDGTFWIVDVERHEVAVGAGGAVKESKYTFKNKGCPCDTCKGADGKSVNVNAKIGFAGFEPMPAEQAALYAAKPAPAPNGGATLAVCGKCAAGDHSHKLHDEKKPRDGECLCEHENHLPF